MSKFSNFLNYVKHGYPDRETRVSIKPLKPGSILEGKKILITTHTGELAFPLAKRFLNEKCEVTIACDKASILDSISDKLSSSALHLIHHDLQDPKKAWILIKKSSDAMAGIDTLIHGTENAFAGNKMSNVSMENWDENMELNLKGMYFLTQSFIRLFSKSKAEIGRILLFTSKSGIMGDTLPFGITKASLASYVEGMSKKIINRGIRINGISLNDSETINHGELSEFILFLASDAANCISGSLLPFGYVGKVR